VRDVGSIPVQRRLVLGAPARFDRISQSRRYSQGVQCCSEEIVVPRLRDTLFGGAPDGREVFELHALWPAVALVDATEI
jgi:hypothetical protein